MGIIHSFMDTITLTLENIGQNELLYKGKAEKIQEQNKTILSFNDENREYEFILMENGCRITSGGIYKSVLTMAKNKSGKSHIDSEFGRIDFLSSLKEYTVTDSQIDIVYSLSIHGEEDDFHFRIRIE